MITLTLYQNCRINDSYKNVFSQQVLPPNYQTSPFSAYLNSLTQFTIVLDQVYQEDNTRFNFLLKETGYTDIYAFNYMKIESQATDNTPNIIRYAFINSITIVNDIGIIDYKLDIWHSFSTKILGLNKSYLKGLRVVNGTGGLIQPNYRTLPIDYEGNNKLVLPTEKYANTDKCYIIVELQSYNGTELGNASEVEVTYVYFNKKITYTHTSSGDVHQGTITSQTDIKFNDINDFLHFILNHKNGKNVGNYSSLGTLNFLNEKYYDIGNIYVIPYFDFSTFLLTTGRAIINNPTNDGLGYAGCIVGLESSSPITSQSNKFQQINTGTFTYNFKRTSVGLINAQIPVVENGTSISYAVYISVNQISCKLFLNIFNKLIDITDNFKLNLPFTQLNGDVLAQQKISRELANRNNTLDLIKNISVGATGLANAGLNYYVGQNKTSYFSNLEEIGTIGLISGMAGIQNANIVGASSFLNIGLSLIKYSAKRKEINAPVYSSTEIILANDISVLNAKYWICDLKISSDNDTYVKKSINEMGYNVYEYLDDISKIGLTANPKTFTDANINYNIIQFGTADTYGNFPLNIKKALDDILMNGIKIWYNTSNFFSDDLYEVG